MLNLEPARENLAHTTRVLRLAKENLDNDSPSFKLALAEINFFVDSIKTLDLIN